MSEEDRERLEAEIASLREQNAAQSVEIERLTRMVDELTRKLNMGSKNSSFPPSTDSPKHQAEATKTRSDRRVEAKAKRRDEVERNRAPGQNLSMRADPDETVDHEPSGCVSCGEDLGDAPVEGFERRQVFDTPDPVIITTEHRSVRRRCSCGTLNRGVFPREATAPTSYGPNVRAAALYLLHGQHLSVERTAEAMSTMLGADVSTGFVASGALMPHTAQSISPSMDFSARSWTRYRAP